MPLFLGYIALLIISGIVMTVFAIGGFGQGAGARALNAFFGLGYLGYGLFLLLFFEGGEFRVFVWALVVPVIAAVRVSKALKQRRETAAFRPMYREFGEATPAVYGMDFSDGGTTPVGRVPGQQHNGPLTPGALTPGPLTPGLAAPGPAAGGPVAAPPANAPAGRPSDTDPFFRAPAPG